MFSKIFNLKHSIIGGLLFFIVFFQMDNYILILNGMQSSMIRYISVILLLMIIKWMFYRGVTLFEIRLSSTLFFKYFILVTLLILINQSIDYYLLSEEPTMAIYKRLISHHIAKHDYITLILPMIFLAPIKEELIFRFFMLSAFKYQSNKNIELIAIIITSALFSLAHIWVYSYFTTFVWLFIIGAVYAHARIKSDSIILPILLHSYTIVLMLAIQQLT